VRNRVNWHVWVSGVKKSLQLAHELLDVLQVTRDHFGLEPCVGLDQQLMAGLAVCGYGCRNGSFSVGVIVSQPTGFTGYAGWLVVPAVLVRLARAWKGGQASVCSQPSHWPP